MARSSRRALPQDLERLARARRRLQRGLLHLRAGAARRRGAAGSTRTSATSGRREWAADELGLRDRVSFERLQVYELARRTEQFDLVLFLGVLYHLRHPLLALDLLAEKARRLLALQTLTKPDERELARRRTCRSTSGRSSSLPAGRRWRSSSIASPATRRTGGRPTMRASRRCSAHRGSRSSPGRATSSGSAVRTGCRSRFATSSTRRSAAATAPPRQRRAVPGEELVEAAEPAVGRPLLVDEREVVLRSSDRRPAGGAQRRSAGAAVAEVVELGLDAVELLVGQALEPEQLVPGGIDRPDYLVELELEGARVAVLAGTGAGRRGSVRRSRRPPKARAASRSRTRTPGRARARPASSRGGARMIPPTRSAAARAVRAPARRASAAAPAEGRGSRLPAERGGKGLDGHGLRLPVRPPLQTGRDRHGGPIYREPVGRLVSVPSPSCREDGGSRPKLEGGWGCGPAHLVVFACTISVPRPDPRKPPNSVTQSPGRA